LSVIREEKLEKTALFLLLLKDRHFFECFSLVTNNYEGRRGFKTRWFGSDTSSLQVPRWLAILMSMLLVMAILVGLVVLVMDAMQTFEQDSLSACGCFLRVA
jgi:hypothetical protein